MEKNRQQLYKQYLMTNNMAAPIGNSQLHNKLPSGCYEMQYTQNGIAFELCDMDTDELLKFEDPTHKTILNEMDDFWGKKQKYKDMGYLHNRAILMFGPPGSGKSCLIKLATSDLVKKGDVVFIGKNINLLSEGLKVFREVEPERRCLVVMEDIDEMGEHSLLQLLDGANTVDNIIYLGTTNFIDRLPKRILRPGRFDRKIEVNHPPASGRKAYFQAKLKDTLDERAINQLVEATDGFSFGHLRELITAVFCLGQDLNQVLKRLSGSGLEKSTATATATASISPLNLAMVKFRASPNKIDIVKNIMKKDLLRDKLKQMGIKIIGNHIRKKDLFKIED